MRFAGETLALLGRPIAFYPTLGLACGGLAPGVFLCQLTYWHGKQRDPDGWIRKSWPELETETGMSRQEQRTARTTLRRLGIVQERVRGVPPTTEYRLDFARLDRVLINWLEATNQMVGSNHSIGCQQPIIPETTPETTPESTASLAGLAHAGRPAANHLAVAFATFWAAYPPRRGRRDRKAESLAAYVKLAPGPLLQARLLEAVAIYAQGNDLPVDACRWLRGRRWEDETGVRRAPTPPRRSPAAAIPDVKPPRSPEAVATVQAIVGSLPWAK